MNNQLKLLLKIKSLFTKHNIDFFLMYGTLLGAIRDGDFLKHDNIDIDVGLRKKDYWKVRKILEDNDELSIKNVWRLEICVFLTNDCHLDLFFFEENGDELSTCAYLANKNQGGINIESQMVYKKEDFFPLKKIVFNSNEFFVPNKPERVLEKNYGDNWMVPEKKWQHKRTKTLNENHRTVGILITTFLRDDKMMKCVNSILKECDDKNLFRKLIRIYIADQNEGDWSEEKTKFYNKLKANGHKVYKTPFNSGISYNRNFLVKKSNEPYLMIIDDDFKFTKNTNIPEFIEILNHKKENGIVGGNISNRPNYHAEMVFETIDNKRTLYRIMKNGKKETVNCLNKLSCNANKNIKYQYTDIVLNFFLAKREVLEEVPWDNNLKLVEHSDHFLRIKKDGRYRVCHTSEVTCEHLPEVNTKEYKQFRWNDIYSKMFLNKWEINKVKTIFEEDINDIECEQANTEKIKVVQIARIPCANSGYELSQLINEYSDEYESRYILGSEYSKGNDLIPYRQFPYDLFWKENKDECIEVLNNADIIHIHHDLWPEIKPYLSGKKIVSTLYNLTNSLQYNDCDFNRKYIGKLKDLGTVTVADQPLQKKMFSDISNTYVPLVKMLFNKNVTKNNQTITVGFSPTNRENTGIGSKRFISVMDIIEKIQIKYNFNFKLIEGLPYEENLEEKSKCDILIDDVDDNYEKAHNSTIESAMFDSIPLTNYNGRWFPAIKTNVNTLEDTLSDLLINKEKINDYRNNILKPWRENVYTPHNLLNIYEKLYNNLNQNKITINDNLINTDGFMNVFFEMDSLLNKRGVEYCLLYRTCLDAVLKGNPYTETNNIFIGVKDIYNARRALKDFNSDIKINIEIYTGETKKLGFCGSAKNVPFPVIGYINKTFGKDWKKKYE